MSSIKPWVVEQLNSIQALLIEKLDSLQTEFDNRGDINISLQNQYNEKNQELRGYVENEAKLKEDLTVANAMNKKLIEDHADISVRYVTCDVFKRTYAASEKKLAENLALATANEKKLTEDLAVATANEKKLTKDLAVAAAN